MGAISGFGRIRSALLKRRPAQLIGLIGELYRLSRENQRFLEARLADPSEQLPVFRKLVTDCLSPDPLRKNAEVRISDAKRAISQYQRATGDTAGTVDLMLTFVEQGTAFAGDFGYGEADFFSSLERMLSRALDLLRDGDRDLRESMRSRLIALSLSARDLGWGYGDFVLDAIDDAIESEE